MLSDAIARAILVSAQWAPVALIAGRQDDQRIGVDWISEALAHLLGATCADELPQDLLGREPFIDDVVKTSPGAERVSTLAISTTTAAFQVELSLGRSSIDDGLWAAVISDQRSPTGVARTPGISEAPYQSLVDSLGECIWLISNGRIAYANASALKLLQTQEGDLDGSLFLTLIHLDDRLQVEHWLGRVLEGDTLPPFECRFAEPNGHARLIELNCAVCKGQGDAIIAFGRDVTERKR